MQQCLQLLSYKGYLGSILGVEVYNPDPETASDGWGTGIDVQTCKADVYKLGKWSSYTTNTCTLKLHYMDAIPCTLSLINSYRKPLRQTEVPGGCSQSVRSSRTCVWHHLSSFWANLSPERSYLYAAWIARPWQLRLERRSVAVADCCWRPDPVHRWLSSAGSCTVVQQEHHACDSKTFTPMTFIITLSLQCAIYFPGPFCLSVA